MSEDVAHAVFCDDMAPVVSPVLTRHVGLKPCWWPLCRYLGAVWTLVVTGMDGIVFWGPILIHTFTDGDSGTGVFL